MPHYAVAFGVANLLNKDHEEHAGGARDHVESEAATIARARRHRTADPDADTTLEEVEEVRGLAPVRRLLAVVAGRPGLRPSSGSS